MDQGLKRQIKGRTAGLRGYDQFDNDDEFTVPADIPSNSIVPPEYNSGTTYEFQPEDEDPETGGQPSQFQPQPNQQSVDGSPLICCAKCTSVTSKRCVTALIIFNLIIHIWSIKNKHLNVQETEPIIMSWFWNFLIVGELVVTVTALYGIFRNVPNYILAYIYWCCLETAMELWAMVSTIYGSGWKF